MFLDIFEKKKKKLQKLLMIAHLGRESVNKNKMSFKFKQVKMPMLVQQQVEFSYESHS